MFCVWIICMHKLSHFTVANTRFNPLLTRCGKTKFATVKWYNLCLQIIQSQTYYPLIQPTFDLLIIWDQFELPSQEDV